MAIKKVKDKEVMDTSTLVCLSCHNKESPMYKEFVPAERLAEADKSFHKHYELKYIKHEYPVVIEPKKAEAKK